jgi:N-acetylneuraminate synthase/sialic acid synthase
MRELSLGSKTITDGAECYVIAEIGHNHQGDVEKAKDMFRVAKECGADAVKLQKRDNRSLFTRAMYDSPYENENSYGATYGEHREALEFGRDEYLELKAYADELGITLFATAFDFKSADFLADLDMPLYKVASADLKNTPLLRHVARIGRPMIISTGGAMMEDVERAYEAIIPINQQLCILQCTASYPASVEDLNLRVLTSFRDRFPEAVVGLSDHQDGIAMSLLAYALGARVFEKHFTLHHTWKGTDQAFSLEPAGMRKMVRDLRRAADALGDGEKRVLPCEVKPLFKMGKKLVAARDLSPGHVLTAEDIGIKSPSDGLPPYELDRLIGHRLATSLLEDDTILWEHVDTNELADSQRAAA